MLVVTIARERSKCSWQWTNGDCFCQAYWRVYSSKWKVVYGKTFGRSWLLTFHVNTTNVFILTVTVLLMIFTENMEETGSAYTWLNFSTFHFYMFYGLWCHFTGTRTLIWISAVGFCLCGVFKFSSFMRVFSQETLVSFHNATTSMLVHWTCQTELHCECRHVCLLRVCVGALMDRWPAQGLS